MRLLAPSLNNPSVGEDGQGFLPHQQQLPDTRISIHPLPQRVAPTKLEAIGPVVGLFSSQHLQYWAEVTVDPWVRATMSRGYAL